MAKKISELPAADAFDGSEAFALVQAGATRRGAVGALASPGAIDGLSLRWASGNALSVTSGLATIPSLGRTVRVNAAIAKAGLALVASTWHHVYLWLNGANPDVEVVTTAPDAPYFGTARAKAGDTSRRYVGSVLTDSAAQLINFAQSGDRVAYVGNPNNRIVSATTSTAMASVAVAPAAPVTASAVTLRVAMNSAGGQGFTVSYTNSNWFNCISPGATLVECPCPAGLIYYTWLAAPTEPGSASIDVMGYRFER